jgi:hypothetical protein
MNCAKFCFMKIEFMLVAYRGKYPRYRGPPVTAQNSRYDRFSPAANNWRTIHPVLGNGRTTSG